MKHGKGDMEEEGVGKAEYFEGGKENGEGVMERWEENKIMHGEEEKTEG